MVKLYVWIMKEIFNHEVVIKKKTQRGKIEERLESMGSAAWYIESNNDQIRNYEI